jgi:polyisoprenoid-binding protein YceI
VPVGTGTHRLGPDNATLQVRTFREGIASRAGHDLVIDVTRWEATLTVAQDPAQSAVELSADPRSLEVREGVRGVKPLTDKDRAEIRRNIDAKVLGDRPISFRSDAVEVAGDGLSARGDLTMAGASRPVSARLALSPDGHVTGTIPLTQSEWGIKPYRGLMGALKVRDAVEVVLDARLDQPDDSA